MHKSDQKVSISIQTKGKLPSLPFVTFKNKILGARYELSVVFVSKPTSQKLNSTFRGKNKPTNILSFPLSPHSGELVICRSVVKLDAPKFEMTEKSFSLFLLIHGMLHLKGHVHGSTMERLEEKWIRHFKLK